MKVIGITGGVGSGKSAVLKLLEEEYHAVVVPVSYTHLRAHET